MTFLLRFTGSKSHDVKWSVKARTTTVMSFQNLGRGPLFGGRVFLLEALNPHSVTV
jgi:hypothetical protein